MKRKDSIGLKESVLKKVSTYWQTGNVALKMG